MPESIAWKDEYNIGNLLIDHEHRELINLANLLLIALEDENGAGAFTAGYEALMRYVEKHFNDEEDLLGAVDSKYLETQRNHHKVLTLELRTLWAQGSDTPPAHAVKDLVKWVQNRLLKHFLTLDYCTFHDFPFVDK